MAVNISQLSPITTTATALSNLVLVTPQSVIGYKPQNGFANSNKNANLSSQPALLFHYEGEQSITLESDITDHYVEDNTSRQDQIALRPETVTTHGFIGELNNVAPVGLQTAKLLADKLTAIGSYTPGLSVTALIAYNTAFQLYQVTANAIASGVSAWNFFNGSGGESVIGNSGLIVEHNQNRQQTMFQQFHGYWSNRVLFTVQTPWAVFQNMAIRSLRAIQDSETNAITDFEVTFKRMRLATTSTLSEQQTKILQGRAQNQSAPPTNLGTSPVVKSISLESILGGF